MSTSTIPDSVTLADLREAMEPLCSLLGISIMDMYAVPGFSLCGDLITFTVPATLANIPGNRRVKSSALLPDFEHPQGNEAAELSFVVSVKVERP